MLVKFSERGSTINGQYYANALIELHDSIKTNRRGKLSSVMLLLDDDVPMHCAEAISDCLQDLDWSRLKHSTYSPDLAPHDIWVFQI